MNPNKYPGKCVRCGDYIPAMKGTITRVKGRWRPIHADCQPRIITTRFNSGRVAYVNAAGRCEDAPCCGCCS